MKTDRKFLCDNGECMAELSVKMTEEKFDNRFYFSKCLPCPVCGIGKMYKVKQ